MCTLHAIIRASLSSYFGFILSAASGSSAAARLSAVSGCTVPM